MSLSTHLCVAAEPPELPAPAAAEPEPEPEPASGQRLASVAARPQAPPVAMPAGTPGAPPSLAGDAIGACPQDDVAWRVLRRFRSVFNAVKTHFQQVEKQAGLGGAQVWALSLVRDQPGLGVSALARAMDVHQTTASNLVRALIDQGLLASQRSDSDRRATQLSITAAGEQVLQRVPGPFGGVLPDALQRLDPATLARLEIDLQALLGLLQADRRGERIPLAQL